jgi:nicotinamide-nucleotide amidase
MGDYVAPLEARVGALLKTRQMTLAVAESCTGGLIMHRLTNVAGSSEYFPGGVVAYAYEAKVKLLGVNPDDLGRYGAVSETVAEQMAQGVRAVFDTQIGLSVTGIAGPGGGLPDKPVGLTYIGFCGWGSTKVIKRIWTGDREQNKQSSAEAALQLLYDCLVFKD